jgi:hypothetical protein
MNYLRLEKGELFFLLPKNGKQSSAAKDFIQGTGKNN